MKVKIGELRTLLEGLTVLSEKDLPAKRAYWIGKTINKLSSEYKTAEETRQKLCEQHCKKDEKGEFVTKSDENGNQIYSFIDQDKFNKDIIELWEVEIEIEFKPIPIDDLGDIKIDPMSMLKIDKFIVGVEK